MYPKVKIGEEKYQDDEHVAVGLQLLESLSLNIPSSPEKVHRDVSPIFIARFPKSPVRNLVVPKNSAQCQVTEVGQDHKKSDQEKETANMKVAYSNSFTEAEQNDEKTDHEEETPNIRVAFLKNDSPTSSADAEKSDVKIDETGKPTTRAGPILRPRAVLSSPNNDAVIGSGNNLKAEPPAAVRNHDSVPSRHVKAQCKASPTHVKGHRSRTSSSDVHVSKSDLKAKKGSATATPSKKTYLRTWKF